MGRTLVLGWALAIAGAIGVLSSELVSTAHAGGTARRDYLLAISSGEALALRRSADAQYSQPRQAATLTCAGLVDMGVVSIGFQCQSG